MPRTTAVATPGCPPLRALSFDNLGLIKVVESSTENGHPQVVARWGEPNPQTSIVAASLSSDEDLQVLAVARKNFYVEVLDPANGAVYTKLNVRASCRDNELTGTENFEGRESAALVGIHLCSTSASGLRSMLTCTDSGNASIQCFSLNEGELNSSEHHTSPSSWSICKSGNILCMKVDKTEKYAAFGGEGVDVNVWDIMAHRKVWEAKAPRRDSNGLMSPRFVTASTFLGNDHHKLIVGTGDHQVRLFDLSAQRRPVIAFAYGESPIKAVEADTDGHTIFIGTGIGDLASFDMRSGKLLGSYKGKVSGSIRSIAVHPTLPIFATCGLDRFLRVFHKSSRELLARVFLKQPLSTVIFDGKYPPEVSGPNDAAAPSQAKDSVVIDVIKGEGEECSPKKSEKSRRPFKTQQVFSETEMDMESELRASGKTHRKRESQRDLAGEQALARKNKKRKGGSSAPAVKSLHMNGEDMEALAQEDDSPRPTQGVERKQDAKPRRRKKQKKGIAA